MFISTGHDSTLAANATTLPVLLRGLGPDSLSHQWELIYNYRVRTQEVAVSSINHNNIARFWTTRTLAIIVDILTV